MNAWTQTELETLRRLYADTDMEGLLAALPSRTPHAISQKAHKLRLVKSEAHLQVMAKRCIEAGLKHRFVKGHTAHNKGKPVPEHIKAKYAATMFQPGQLPHNTKSDGAISIRIDKAGRPYKWIRVGLAKWEMLHRYMWEKENGTVPKGMIVVFKDGNPMNCETDNLELISRNENMRRNTVHNYPQEVKELIYIKAGFKHRLTTIEKKINNHTHNNPKTNEH